MNNIQEYFRRHPEAWERAARLDLALFGRWSPHAWAGTVADPDDPTIAVRFVTAPPDGPTFAVMAHP
jgi:hypothetical protein